MRNHSRLGFTLVEIVISILLVAIGVVAIFSISTAVRQQTGKSQRREQVAQHNRQIQDELKNFVRPDPAQVTVSTVGAPGNPPWHLEGDTCQVPPNPACAGYPNCWALEACVHDATTLLPPEFRNSPMQNPPGVNGKMTYTVTVQTVNGKDLRKVEVKIQWDESRY